MKRWMGGGVRGWRGWIPSWLMLARSPVEEQLRPMGGGVDGVERWRGGEVDGWRDGGGGGGGYHRG